MKSQSLRDGEEKNRVMVSHRRTWRNEALLSMSWHNPARQGLARQGEATQDKDRQLRHNTGMAMFGTLIQATGKRALRQLEQRVANSGGKIDAKGTLKLVGWLGD